MSIVKFILVALTSSTLTCAVDVEFPGFAHFHNWHGEVGDLVIIPSDPDGSQLSPDLSKDICGQSSKCTTFGGNSPQSYYRYISSNSSYDMFLAYDASIVPSAACVKETGGCNTPTQNWLHCDSFDMLGNFGDDPRQILNFFQLPPALIHDACIADPKCMGFRVNNDQGSGETLKLDGGADGWFKTLY